MLCVCVRAPVSAERRARAQSGGRAVPVFGPLHAQRGHEFEVEVGDLRRLRTRNADQRDARSDDMRQDGRTSSSAVTNSTSTSGSAASHMLRTAGTWASGLAGCARARTVLAARSAVR
jgi:hypothetical protein